MHEEDSVLRQPVVTLVDAEKGPHRLASRGALSSRAREALSARSGHYVTSVTLPAQLARLLIRLR
jgi:hypothetical protein